MTLHTSRQEHMQSPWGRAQALLFLDLSPQPFLTARDLKVRGHLCSTHTAMMDFI